MAFAKLVFPSGTLPLRKLKEIARFATGVVTGSSDLEFADTSLSEIVVTEPAGWTLQAQSFEASGTATSGSYRLTAPCVDTGKNKAVLMGTYTARSVGGSSINTPVSYTTPTSGSASAFMWFQLGSSWSGSTLNNPVIIPTSVTRIAGSGTETRIDPMVSLVSDIIYISSTARKLIVFGIESTGRVDIASVLEFKETAHTTKNNNIPALCSLSSRFDADSPTVMATNLTGAGATQTVYYSHQLANWFVPALGTRTSRHESDYGINNVEFFTSPGSLNVTAAGSPAYPLIPLISNRNVYSEGIHNYSTLTDFYITYRGSSYAGNGDVVNLSGQDYVVLQCGPATANYRAFAVKKA